MYMVDFEYNGELLSEYNCMLGSIETSIEESISMGSELSLETVKTSNKDNILFTKYNDVISVTFDILKRNCYDQNDMYFTDADISRIMIWLNRKEYHKFKPLYDDDKLVDVYYYGTFTKIDAIYIAGEVVGFTLTFTANAPYGFTEVESFEQDLSSTASTFNVYNNSQDLGYLYPSVVKITCGTSGDISIVNTTDNSSRRTIVGNCSNGEIITMDCEHKVITSSISHPKLCNDFNYNWLRLIREYDELYNVFTFDTGKMSKAKIYIEYTPIRKVGVMA